MIRHSSSFVVSLLIHLILAVFIFFGWKTYASISEIKEQKLCVKLCHVVHKKPTVTKPQKKKIPKKIKPKKIKPKKIKPKKGAPKKIKKKIVEKKVEPSPIVVPLKDAQPIEAIQEVVQVDKNETKDVEPEKELLVVEKRNSEDTKEKSQTSLEEEYINEHVSKISQLLQDNLYYPRSARKRGIVGDVMVKFTLNTDAEAQEIKVLSSDHEVLSRAAIKTIESLSGKFPKPKEKLTLHVPINYNLK